jgi:hypothetical protein
MVNNNNPLVQILRLVDEGSLRSGRTQTNEPGKAQNLPGSCDFEGIYLMVIKRIKTFKALHCTLHTKRTNISSAISLSTAICVCPA